MSVQRVERAYAAKAATLLDDPVSKQLKTLWALDQLPRGLYFCNQRQFLLMQ